jgi:hypothetical protein
MTRGSSPAKIRRMPKPFQYRLRTIFYLTTLVAVGCLVGPPFIRDLRARFFAPVYSANLDIPVMQGSWAEMERRETQAKNGNRR